MPEIYGRDLDLNLLRVFAVVAESGGVTAAAAQLYLTQPAISAALRRLTGAVGAPLFVRQGRGLALTSRGERLLVRVRTHLPALLDAALAPATFDPRASDRTMRLGLSDSAEIWLLPALVRRLARLAPQMRIIAVPIQFRTVAAALSAGRVDIALTVADEMPAGVRRQALFWGDFVCLFDPRHARIRGKLREVDYFAHEHVIVSYNADLRGIVEDMLGKVRRVRCSVASFANLGPLIDGSALLGTVPTHVARQIQRTHPGLRTRPLPFSLAGVAGEMLWPAAADDDEAGRFVRAQIAAIASKLVPGKGAGVDAQPRLRS